MYSLRLLENHPHSAHAASSNWQDVNIQHMKQHVTEEAEKQAIKVREHNNIKEQCVRGIKVHGGNVVHSYHTTNRDPAVN